MTLSVKETSLTTFISAIVFSFHLLVANLCCRSLMLPMQSRVKTLTGIIIIGVCILVHLVVYNHISSFENFFKSKYLLRQKTEERSQQIQMTILYWYRPWGTPFNGVLSEECGKCILTDDQSKINSDSTGAVVFHYNELHYDTLPTERNPDQFYVYLSMESSAFVLREAGRDLHEYDGVFNWTMTYRRDSDIYHPYYTMADVMNEIKRKFDNTDDVGISWIMKQKKRFAVWIVSNCAKNRMKLVEEMVQAGIDIDRRGNCFPHNPPAPGPRAARGNQKQHDFMTSSKFYIAFENSHHCKDYITEKLFENSFLVGTVPIVWGPTKADYEAVVPPHSCIFMDDFAGNLDKLADYLKYLDKNDTAYEEYLSWRTMDAKDMFGFGKTTGHCKLCQTISGIKTDTVEGSSKQSFGFPSSRKTIKSLKSWVYSNEEEECLQ